MDQGLISNQNKQSNQILLWIVSIFVLLCLTLIFSILTMVYALKCKRQKISNSVLPDKYIVPSSFILPPTNQSNIGTCWSFAMVYLLESQYRDQAIRAGFLHDDEYVSFSKQALFTWLHEQCVKNPTEKVCQYGGLPLNMSSDNEIEALYYFVKAFPDLNTSILPESVCPYLSMPDDLTNWSYFICPDLHKALEKNPIEFKIKSITSAYGLNDIKKLLIEKNRALGIGTPLPYMRYWIPCSDPSVSASDNCVNQVYPCPSTSGIQDPFCSPVDIDGRQRDGVFLSQIDPIYVAEMGGHAMNLVGYNDDWLLRNRFLGSNMAPLKGGFILHNSWTGQGHSVEYLMGNRSEENENVICPNHMVPMTWIPSTYQCIADHAEDGDISSCADDYVLPIRGKGRASGPDILKCTSTNQTIAAGLNCDIRRNYVLLRKDDQPSVSAQPGGLDKVDLISFVRDGNRITDIKNETRSDFPFWYLHKVYKPVEFVENDELQCGYWILPYTTYDLMRRINYDLFDNFKVTDIEIEFEHHSFANSSYSKDYDLSYLKNSTKVFKKTEFDGPLPFEYVY